MAMPYNKSEPVNQGIYRYPEMQHGVIKHHVNSCQSTQTILIPQMQHLLLPPLQIIIHEY